MENCLALAGFVCKPPETRTSPAGIPITRFTLEHRSRQVEAGMQREAFCRVVVVAAGKELTKQAECLSEGVAVKVVGFIARADNRQGEQRITLHAQSIQADVQS